MINSVQDGEGPIQLSSFYNKFPQLVSPNVGNTSHLATSKMSDKGNLSAATTTSSKSPSASGSHTSSSSCSTGVKQLSLPAEENGGMLKKARSHAELHEKGQEKTKLMIRSYSHKLLSEGAALGASAMPENNNQENHEDVFRVRVAFGEQNIRLSLQQHWDFKHLQQEIFTRFCIENGAGFNLKYLDDDAEWVLLTCDDDLDECRDIHSSSKSPTIKLAVTPNLGSSFGSDAPN